jgi:nitrogen fixation NifU-like protein
MNIYQEKLLEHYHNPHNYGKLIDAKHSALVENVNCGDAIEIFVNIDNNRRIQQVGFEGEGCAVAIASVSLLTDHVKGKTVDEVQKMNLADVIKLLEIEVSLSRLRCAGLGLDALKKATGNFLDRK